MTNPKLSPARKTKGDEARNKARSRPKRQKPVMKESREVYIPNDAELCGWYVLTTAPQSEQLVVDLLQERGFDAINPVEEVEVRMSRKARYQRIVRQRAMLTSMVLLAHLGPVPWLSVLELSRITGVIGVNGSPSRIPAAAALKLIRRSGLKARTRKPSLMAGEKAAVVEGPFEGFEGKVVSARNGRVHVMLGLSGVFGEGERAVDLPEESLERLAS